MSAKHLSSEPVRLTVEDSQSGWRLDLFLVHHFPDYSRVLLRKVISAGGVTIDGRNGKPAYRLNPGQCVEAILPELPRESPQAEDIPLDILYEDDWLAVVNKPPNMVVHPARGHWSGTLVAGLQFRFAGQLSTVGGPTRPGIVHRLDRDTSGAILVAKNDIAHGKLGTLFEKREIQKEYFALVAGRLDRDRDLIDEPIGSHPHQREKMAIRRGQGDGKSAVTFYEVAQRFDGFTAVRAFPKTGRTHQIRIHLAHVGCPILCDRQYGGRSRITRGELTGNASDETVLLQRQALHAARLTFPHPITGKEMTVEAPLADDLADVVEVLRTSRSQL